MKQMRWNGLRIVKPCIGGQGGTENVSCVIDSPSVRVAILREHDGRWTCAVRYNRKLLQSALQLSYLNGLSLQPGSCGCLEAN